MIEGYCQLHTRTECLYYSSGIFPKYLNGENIISVPLAENETMHIGYVLNENQELSELGKSYLEELRKYAPANP